MEFRSRVFESLHHIDLDNNAIVSKRIDEGDLDEYLVDLIEAIMETPNSRYFKVQSNTTEIIALINGFMEEKSQDEFIEISEKIANRLLRHEVQAKEKYKNITEIQRGSLIQSLIEFTDNREFFFLIAKVEHESFLNTIDLVKQIGLPFEKRVLKTCLLKYNEENEILEIIITDTNNRISTYWWSDFLELEEMNSDEKNTKTAFNAIDLVLTQKLKKQAPSDYTILRNNLIGYFRTQEDFQFDSMVSSVFGNYQSDNISNEELNEIRRHVTSLPEKKGFDKHFSIIDKEIKARIRKTIQLSDKIELNLKDHISELRHNIRSEVSHNGERQIVIKTENEEAFNLFYFKEEG
ncbi:nucleoid-associated protein [Paenibacillus vini]|uniref:37-kD nucleoid-associated bacterial protein n=1 Tax=Paenibacillus vini TaxID=1476024 RepID=A0ABQ4MA91_9BACL|nr:nucleoid-associated protein [Paenibacillus vini]GIP52911.1 hypothetical protein J42TS3_19460 [Paenibacillus vini]